MGLTKPVLAQSQGTLQWGTCPNPVATITDANTGGELVPVGGLVELWNEGGATPLNTARIGDGYIPSEPGRVAVNSDMPPGSYDFQLRVFDVPDPYAPDVRSCSVIVGANGRGTSGISMVIGLDPATICFPSAEIPAGDYSIIQGGGCQVLAPLAVTLDFFAATSQGEAVLVEWDTASEIGNRGFNLYRGPAADGPWMQLNAALIPSQSQGNIQGYHYEYLDEAVVSGTTYFYLLESVDLSGSTAQHGPVSVFYTGAPTAVALSSLSVQAVVNGSGLPIALLALASLGLVTWTLRRR